VNRSLRRAGWVHVSRGFRLFGGVDYYVKAVRDDQSAWRLSVGAKPGASIEVGKTQRFTTIARWVHKRFWRHYYGCPNCGCPCDAGLCSDCVLRAGGAP
jgi:hypothetical protein